MVLLLVDLATGESLGQHLFRGGPCGRWPVVAGQGDHPENDQGPEERYAEGHKSVTHTFVPLPYHHIMS